MPALGLRDKESGKSRHEEGRDFKYRDVPANRVYLVHGVICGGGNSAHELSRQAELGDVGSSGLVVECEARRFTQGDQKALRHRRSGKSNGTPTSVTATKRKAHNFLHLEDASGEGGRASSSAGVAEEDGPDEIERLLASTYSP